MFLITTTFQAARSRNNPDRPGKVYLRITHRVSLPDGSASTEERTFNTGIEARSSLSVKEIEWSLVPFVRLAYNVLEELHDTGTPFNIDDVAERVRKRMANPAAIQAVDCRATMWRSEVATPGKGYKKYFKINPMPPKSVQTSDRVDSLLEYLQSMALKFKEEGRENTFSSYICTRNSIGKFLAGNDICLHDIDRAFVEKYAQWLLDQGAAPSTQSFYLRTLRATLNHAGEKGIIAIDSEMFLGLNTKANYDRKDKEANLPDRRTLLRIATIDLAKDAKLDLARDMFMFAFYCRGMELTDILGLTTANIHNGILTYRRRGKGLEKNIVLDTQARRIIAKYRQKEGSDLFPLRKMYEGQLITSIKFKVALWLREIGRLMGLNTLSFGMNIAIWQRLVAQVEPTELLGQ